MDTVEVSTVVYAPPEEVYDFLVDFPRYADYSEHLRAVRADGDGSPGTSYALEFAWWKVSYTAHTEVTDVDPPNRIDWEVSSDIDAFGHWQVEAATERAPPDVDTASLVSLSIRFDGDSVTGGAVDLPRLVSLSWVVEKVKPLVQREAERVVERIVADLEGEPRQVELTIHATPDSV